MKILLSDGRDIDRALAEIRQALDDGPVDIAITPCNRRSLQANALMWVKLGELERTKRWHGKRLAASNWKHLISAGIDKMMVVPNINNDGFVSLGKATSRMSVKQMNQVIDMADYLLATLE